MNQQAGSLPNIPGRAQVPAHASAPDPPLDFRRCSKRFFKTMLTRNRWPPIYICNGYRSRMELTHMPPKNPDPEQMLPLTPAVFHILLALAEGERHGYAIMQSVAGTTEGQIKMGPGTLYGTIKRLLEARWIEESDERPDPELDDERRRYYRLTGFGRRVVQAEAMRYSKLVKAARAKHLIGEVAAATLRVASRGVA